jgi:Ca-activated chloride channel family protein
MAMAALAVAAAVVSQMGWVMAAPVRGAGEGEAGPDKTLAPFFFVQVDDPATDRLPLKATEARVRIAGVTADVTIVQTYSNEGQRALEAIYVFPASNRAAVYAMRMTVGERVIDAEIMERAKAREAFDQARASGRTASLLEQQRPNVFQMHVANILPGDLIRVELKYTEVLEPQEGLYEFVYPAVVGPRYSGTPEAGAPEAARWVHNPYLHAGEPPPYRFGLAVELLSAIPIARLESPSHAVDVEYTGKSQARVRIQDDPRSGTRDFVLRYGLAGGQIQSGVLLHRGRDANHFLLLMEPPARVAADSVLPREYIFILDVSGSMNGFPLAVSKALMSEVIGALGSRDFMNVLLFAGGSAVLSEAGSLPATEENKARALSWIRSQRGGGGTELMPALERALRLPRTEGVSRIVVVATDGYVSVEPQAFELIRHRLGEANLFAFGIGSSVNRHIIEGMARAGRGEPFVLLDEHEARRQAARFREYIRNPVLTDIRISFRGFQARDVEPLCVPDLFALRPVMLLGRFDGAPSGEVVIRGRTAHGPWERVIPVSDAAASSDIGALGLLWARHRIMRLSDLNLLRPDDARVKEVTTLGLTYGLMTRYTSFVAADKVKRGDGRLVTVKQPLPLPEGVSDLAVGGPLRAAKALSGPAPTGGAAQEQAVGPAAPGELPGVGPEGDRKGERPAVQVDEVRGGLDRTAVERALRQALKQTRCPGGGDGAPWEAVFRVVVGAAGKVDALEVVSTTSNDPALLACLTEALRGAAVGPAGRGKAEALVKLTG